MQQERAVVRRRLLQAAVEPRILARRRGCERRVELGQLRGLRHHRAQHEPALARRRDRRQRHGLRRVEQGLQPRPLDAAELEELLPPAALAGAVALEQQEAQLAGRGQLLDAREGREPALQDRALGGGVVDDQERRCVGGEGLDVGAGVEAGELVGGDEAGVPAARFGALAEVEGEAGLAAAGFAGDEADGDRLRAVEPGVELGLDRVAADQRGDGVLGEQQVQRLADRRAQAVAAGDVEPGLGADGDGEAVAVAAVLDGDVVVARDRLVLFRHAPSAPPTSPNDATTRLRRERAGARWRGRGR